MENFSEQDFSKFMLFMRKHQAQETVKTTNVTAVTERPEAKMKATTLLTEGNEDLNFSIKNDFIVEERIRSLVSRSKFYEALSLRENIESANEMDIGIKLLIAECYIQLGRESKAERTIREIEHILLEPPNCDFNDVVHLAEDLSHNSTSYIRALLLLRIASDIVINDSTLSPDDKIDEIFRCIKKMDDVIDEMVKPPDVSEGVENIIAIQRALTADSNGSIDAPKISGNKNKSSQRTLALASDYGVDIMRDMLGKIQSIQDAEPGHKILRAAQSYNFISTHYGPDQFTKAAKVLENGIELVEKQFGNNASQYSIYGTMLKNLGTVYHNVEKYKEAEPLKIRAVEALEFALDHNSEGEKQNEIKSAQESLRITRTHLKLA